MDKCNFTWVANDGRRVQCLCVGRHPDKVHFHGTEKVVIGLEMMAKFPAWVPKESGEGYEWSAAHSSNYGKDSV